MKTYVFPGQGSQTKGMGKSLFDNFKDLTQIADDILGYSIKQLCVENPSGNLNKTQYTQPALYVVNALSCYNEIEVSGESPDYVAGHSLGEYNALLASGAFSFDTGLKLVKQRGLLMSRVSGGAMAAILGISHEEVKEILNKNILNSIDIANLNEPSQTVISGLKEDITNAEQYFQFDKVRFFPLNTSGAFHSRYMKNIKEEFNEFLHKFSFSKLNIPVISNIHARPYVQENIVESLTNQITSPVKWTETIKYLLNIGKMEFVETGNGVVLSRLIEKIKNAEKPLKITDNNYSTKIQPTNSEVESFNTADKKNVINQKNNIINDKNQNIVFMYGGQGSHYFQMGKELYKDNHVFRRSMNLCSEILEGYLNRSIVDDIYLDKNNSNNFDNILITHAAIFSVEYSLTQILLDQNIRPTAVLGYSLGEYVAATVAEMLSLEDALKLTALQASMLSKNNNNGAMLVVLSDVSNFSSDLGVYRGCTLAGINYENNFVISGTNTRLTELQLKLNKAGVISEFLSVNHAFHSELIDPIKIKFEEMAKQLKFMPSSIPVYSSQDKNLIFKPNVQHLWNAIRIKVNFKSTVSEIQQKNNSIYVDLSPTGTLSNIIKYGFKNTIKSYFAVNRFCQNNDSVNALILRLNAMNITSDAYVES